MWSRREGTGGMNSSLAVVSMLSAGVSLAWAWGKTERGRVKDASRSVRNQLMSSLFFSRIIPSISPTDSERLHRVNTGFTGRSERKT